MTKFLNPDNCHQRLIFASSEPSAAWTRVARSHLRDLVYLHPGAASASAVVFV